MKSNSNEVVFKEFIENLKKDSDVIISDNYDLDFTIIFQEQICDITVFNQDLLPELRRNRDKDITEVLTGIARKIDLDSKDLYQILFNGLMIYYDKVKKEFYLLDISKNLRRQTGDSNVEANTILGSRDGFTENYKDNIALLRGRLKNSNFLIEEHMIGRRSKTWVGLLYIEDIHNIEMKNELSEKIKEIDIDALLSINDVIPFLSKRSILPIANYIGTPDIAIAHLLDGEFLLLIDRIPIVLALPADISSLTLESIDLIENKPIYFLHRILILLCFILSTVFPGIYLSLCTYQIDLLSLPLLSTLVLTEKGAPFPIFIEIAFVLFLFELYHLVGYRSSEKNMSSTIVLIGGLIIGQNLIDSGLVGVLTITVVALCFLAGFVCSNNIDFIFGISILRLFFLIAGLFFGIYGITLLVVGLSVYFSKQSLFSHNVLYPFIPFDWKGVKNFFIPRSSKSKVYRNTKIGLTDMTMKEDFLSKK